MSSIENRYEKTYTYKNIEFYLSDYTPNDEECRLIILKLTEQASRDYLTLYNADSPALQQVWETAKEFIFNDIYIISWGHKNVTPTYLLNLINIDIEWLRRKIRKCFQKLKSKKGISNE